MVGAFGVDCGGPLAGVGVWRVVGAFGVDWVGTLALLLAGVGVWGALGTFGADCGGGPLVGVGVWGAVGAFGADCGGGPLALPLVGVGVRVTVGAFVAVAARPAAGGTGVSSSCEEETCRKYSHGTFTKIVLFLIFIDKQFFIYSKYSVQ